MKDETVNMRKEMKELNEKIDMMEGWRRREERLEGRLNKMEERVTKIEQMREDKGDKKKKIR